ncbi:hypothetical protein CSUI_006483 [Cystoisospora suis]|uniref:Transmembrane protein n=1 Tax=Cystoisospora suis TaxID=483139 RepID=A0A2C6KUB4_9APIC|nr:hypothetical protein CSUI_006483 [Cystoisospora suis]
MEDNGFPLELENPMQEDEFFCDISLSSFTDSPFTTLDIALNGSTSPAATGHSRGAAYLPGGNHWNDAADRVISSSDSSRGGKPSTTSTGHVTSKYEACHADRFTYPKDTEPSVHYPRSLHQPSAAGETEETEDSYTALAFSVASAGKTSAFLGLRSAEEQEKKTADTSESPVSPRTRAPHLSDCTAEPPKLAREPRETENLQRSATGLSLQSPFSSPQNEAAAREEHVSPLKNDSSVCPGVEVQSGTTRDEVSPSTEVSSQNSIGKDHHTEVREGRRISTFKPESSQGEHLRSKEMALPGGGSGHGEDSPAQNRTTTLTSGEAEETTHRGVSTEDGMRHKGDKEEDMGGQERRQGDELFPHHEFNSAQHAADESALNADDGETGWTSFQSSPAVEADAGQRGVLSSPPLGGPSAPSAEQHDRPFSSSQLPPPCTPAVLSPGPGETRETHGDRGAPVAARSSSSVSSSAGEADVLRAVACKKLGLLRMKDWEDERQARSTAIARLVADLTAGLTSAVEQSIAVSSHTARYLRARSKADLDYARALKATGSGGGRGKNAQTRYGFLLQGNVSSNPSHRGTIPSPSNASSGSTMERISSTSHTNHRRSSISSLGPDHGTYAANREKNCLEATLRTANSTPAASHSLCSWTNSTAAEEDVHKRHTPSYSRGGLRRESLQETEGAGENLFKDRFVSHKETYALSNVRGRCMKRSFKGSEISKQRNSPFKQETAFGDSSTSIAPKDGVEDASRHWTPGSLYEDMTIDSANEFPREENAGGECLFSSAETCAFPHFGQGLGDSCCAIDGKKKQEGGLLPKTWNEQGGQHSRSSISSDVECTSSSRRGSISDQRSASTGSSGRSRRRWSSATTFLQHFSPLQLGRSPGERRHSLTITEESESHVSSITYTGPEKEKGHINSWSEDRRSAGGSRRKSEEDSHTSHSFSKRGTLWSLHDDKKQSSVRQEGKTEYVVAWPSAACSSSIDHMEGGHSFEKSQVKEKGRDGRRSSNGEPLEAHDDRGGRGKKEEEERATTADHPKVKKTHLQQSRGMFPELSSTSWFLALLEMHDQNAFQMETLGTFVHSELVQDHLQRLCVEYDRETNKYLENLKKVRLLRLDKEIQTSTYIRSPYASVYTLQGVLCFSFRRFVSPSVHLFILRTSSLRGLYFSLFFLFCCFFSPVTFAGTERRRECMQKEILGYCRYCTDDLDSFYIYFV